MPTIETNRRKVWRGSSEGWVGRAGGDHDVYVHPDKPFRIVVPRHRSVSIGVARKIARQAGWI